MANDFKEYLSMVAVALSIGGAVYTWITSRSRGNEKHIDAIKITLADHDTRLTKLQGEFEHLPTKDGQHRLELAMGKLAGDMTRVSEVMNITRTTVDRMESSLLNGNDK